MPLDFQFLRIQTALFLSTIDLTDRLTMAVAIREASENMLSGEPVMLPVPVDAPGEIPRLRLNEAEGNWACQVAPKRLDFFFECSLEQMERDEPTDVMEIHFKLTTDVWNQLQDQFRAKAHRIGLITRVGAEVSRASSLLRETFLRTASFDSSHKLEVHALHKLKMKEYDVNRWVRLRASQGQSDGNDSSKLFIDTDINTLPQHRLDLSTENVTRFLREALSLLEDTRQDLVVQMQEGQTTL